MQKALCNALIGSLVAGIVAIMAGLCLYLGSHTVEAEHIHCHECAVCGAHIIEYWQVRDMADTEWITVCRFCYRDLAYD